MRSASTAQAADLLVNSPAPSYGGFVNQSGGWDGAYLGGFVGYGFGTATQDAADALFALDDELDLSGWTVGVTLGANFTVTEGFILGAAGDIAWAGIGGATGAGAGAEGSARLNSGRSGVMGSDAAATGRTVAPAAATVTGIGGGAGRAASRSEGAGLAGAADSRAVGGGDAGGGGVAGRGDGGAAAAVGAGRWA